MPFTINNELLTHSRTVLSKRTKLYWVVGGAGSGKTTICRVLSAQFNIPVYDMDEHIYGTYHGRLYVSPDRNGQVLISGKRLMNESP